MGDGNGLAKPMHGLDRVREADGEVTIGVETTEAFAWCERCGCRAEPQARMWVHVRDLDWFGRSKRRRFQKRRWRCSVPLCSVSKSTAPHGFLGAQVAVTRRTGVKACWRVGDLARPVWQVVDRFGVCWDTVMNTVVVHATPLVDDPGRFGAVRQLGVDESSFFRANRYPRRT